MALFHYYDTTTVRSQHHLLAGKPSIWHSLLPLKTIIFESSSKRNAISQALSRLKIKENLQTTI